MNHHSFPRNALKEGGRFSLRRMDLCIRMYLLTSLLYLCASTHLFLSYPKSEKEGLHVAFFFLKHSATYVIYSFTVFFIDINVACNRIKPQSQLNT